MRKWVVLVVQLPAGVIFFLFYFKFLSLLALERVSSGVLVWRVAVCILHVKMPVDLRSRTPPCFGVFDPMGGRTHVDVLWFS